MSQYKPFAASPQSDAPVLSVRVGDEPFTLSSAMLIRDFDTGNGHTLAYRNAHGAGHAFVIRDMLGRDCCLLQADADFSHCHCTLRGDDSMQAFGLNNALMLAYAFAASRYDALLIHASCVLHRGRAYAFTAKSGTGKSTHANLWMANIEDVQLLNDDNPVVRFVNGKPMAFGTPWSGKTPCHRNVSAPLGAVVKIVRGSSNSIERFSPAMAFASMMPACAQMRWHEPINEAICTTITRLVESIPIYALHCLPNDEAARVCHDAVAHTMMRP